MELQLAGGEYTVVSAAAGDVPSWKSVVELLEVLFGFEESAGLVIDMLTKPGGTERTSGMRKISVDGGYVGRTKTTLGENSP